MLPPSYFGPRMQQYLESKLYSDVEGTCSGQFGSIIAVVSISDIGKGMVVPGNGQAEFVTHYRVQTVQGRGRRQRRSQCYSGERAQNHCVTHAS